MMDVSVYNGFTGLLDYQASILQGAGHSTTIVGMASGEPIVTTPTHYVRGTGARTQARAAVEIVRYALRQRPDLVVLTQAGAPLVAPIAMALRSAAIPLIYDCMDPVIEVIRSGIGPGPVFYALKPWLIVSHRIIDRSVAATLSVSPGLDRILRMRGWVGPILRFYNIHGTRLIGRKGFSGVRTAHGWESATILVYAGGLQQGFRGLEDQIRAVSLACRRGLNLRFLIVGYGNPAPFLKIADECGVAESVRIMPDMPPAALADILADCDVAVSNSLPYALPSKIFEYINNGVRIISINDGNDVNNLCAEFVELYDSSLDGLAAALIRVASQPPAAGDEEKRRGFLEKLRAESELALLSCVETPFSGQKDTTPKLKVQQ